MQQPQAVDWLTVPYSFHALRLIHVFSWKSCPTDTKFFFNGLTVAEKSHPMPVKFQCR